MRVGVEEQESNDCYLILVVATGTASGTLLPPTEKPFEVTHTTLAIGAAASSWRPVGYQELLGSLGLVYLRRG